MLLSMGRIRSIIRQALHTTHAIRRTPRTKGPIAPFHAGMTMDQAWVHHPGAPLVFERFNLPSCSDCAVRFEETIEEAVGAYGIDLDDFLAALNTLRS